METRLSIIGTFCRLVQALSSLLCVFHPYTRRPGRSMFCNCPGRVCLPMPFLLCPSGQADVGFPASYDCGKFALLQSFWGTCGLNQDLDKLLKATSALCHVAALRQASNSTWASQSVLSFLTFCWRSAENGKGYVAMLLCFALRVFPDRFPSILNDKRNEIKAWHKEMV